MTAKTDSVIIERAKELLANGLARKTVAAICGVSEKTLYRHIPATLRPQKHYSEREKQRARELLDDGCSFLEVARTLGCSNTSVAAWYPGAGWTKRQGAEFGAAIRQKTSRRGA